MAEVYIWLLPVATILALLSDQNSVVQKSVRKRMVSQFSFFVLLLLLIIVSGLRYQVYGDTDEYRYRNGVLNLIGVNFDLSDYTIFDEPGNYILYWISANVFKNDQAYIFITALITVSLILFAFRRESENFTLTIFLFIASGAFFYSFSAIRQYLAAAIVLWATKYIHSREIKKYLVYVFIASLIHVTAWLLVLLYFIPCIKNYRAFNFGLVISSIVLTINMPLVLKFVLTNSDFSNYLDKEYYGMSTIRVVVWIFTYILIFFGVTKMKSVDENQVVSFEMTVASMCCYIMGLSFVYFGRLEIYFGLGAMCIVDFIYKGFKARGRVLIVYPFMILFSLYGLYSSSLLQAYRFYFGG